MTSFRGKLRQFISVWIAVDEAVPKVGKPVRGFLFNADDTPRHWAGDPAEFRASILAQWPPANLPGFTRSATEDVGRLAA
jgi:hypothetical protein